VGGGGGIVQKGRTRGRAYRAPIELEIELGIGKGKGYEKVLEQQALAWEKLLMESGKHHNFLCPDTGMGKGERLGKGGRLGT